MDLFSAILREYQGGRGPVYADTRRLSADMVEELDRCFFTTERPAFKKFFEARKTKIGWDLIEINLREPVLCGGHGINGLKANSGAETNVPGLYAAGDAAANGTSLMGAFALGRIAGREAAKFGGKGEDLTPDWNEAEAEKDRVFAPLRRSEGVPPALLERKLWQAVTVRGQPEIGAIMASLLAMCMGARKVIALINRSSYVDLLQGGTIDISLSPAQASIGPLLTHIRRGDMVRVHSLRHGAAEALEAVVHGDSRTSKLIGRAIGEIVLPEGVTIGALARGDQVLMAHHDIVIEAEDHVILFVLSKPLIPKVEKLFQTA